MIRQRNIILFWVLLCSGYLFAMPPVFTTLKAEESLSFEQYQILPGEQIGVVGYSYKRYLSDSVYWGGTGYGAITGERGGYFIGGFIMGGQIKLGPISLEPQIFIGGGGGHGAPQGGGGIFRPSVSITNASWLPVTLTVGHIQFVNGTINSDLIGVGMCIDVMEIVGI